MKITEDEVRHVADLANLSLSDAEVRQFQRDLDEILTHIERLNQLDTESVPAMAQVLYAADTRALRADCERPSLGSPAALANAPLAGAGYFKVPKVIER